MFERIMDVSTGVYVLWGLGVLGILLKMMANLYMKGMVRGSRDLAMAKKRKLRVMRQQYENKRTFGLCGGDEEAYAEGFVKSLRFLTRPMEFWDKSGRFGSLLVCGAMACGFLYYDVSWRGSPDMVTFLLNGFLVCVCLLAFENIVLINNKLEVLKANIRCYLERLPKGSSMERERRSERICSVAPVEAVKLEAGDLDAEIRQLDDMSELAESAAAEPPEEKQEPKEATDDDESLNRFLAEFFS